MEVQIMMEFDGFGLGGGAMGIGMLVFWGVIIAAIAMLVRGIGGSSAQPAAPMRNETPLDILRQRYARGELTKGEFEAMRRDLTAG
jgi:putative membrane protein